MPLTHTAFMLFCHELFSASEIQWQNRLMLVRLHLILEMLPGSAFPSDILKLPLISQI